MTRHTRIRLWLSTYAVLLAIIGIEFLVDYRPAGRTVEPSVFDQDATGSYSTPGANVVAEISARPPFKRDRRPRTDANPKDTQQATRPGELPSHLLLEGVILSPQGRIALIRRNNASETLMLHEGESIDGWILDEISPEAVTLNKGSRSHILPLPHAQ